MSSSAGRVVDPSQCMVEVRKTGVSASPPFPGRAQPSGCTRPPAEHRAPAGTGKRNRSRPCRSRSPRSAPCRGGRRGAARPRHTVAGPSPAPGHRRARIRSGPGGQQPQGRTPQPHQERAAARDGNPQPADWGECAYACRCGSVEARDCMRHEPGVEVGWTRRARNRRGSRPGDGAARRAARRAPRSTAAREHDDTRIYVKRANEKEIDRHWPTVWGDGRRRACLASTAGNGWCPTVFPTRAQ